MKVQAAIIRILILSGAFFELFESTDARLQSARTLQDLCQKKFFGARLRGRAGYLADFRAG